MFTWTTFEFVNSGHYLYFDLFIGVEGGVKVLYGSCLQSLQIEPYKHFGTSRFKPLWSLKDLQKHFWL